MPAKRLVLLFVFILGFSALFATGNPLGAQPASTANQPAAAPSAQPANQPANTPGAAANPAASPSPNSSSQAERPSQTQPVDGMDSPSETMFTFLKAMAKVRQGDEAAAAEATACLAETDLKVDRQLLADQLLAILDRIGEVKPEDLPDALEIDRTGITRFRYFPRTQDHEALKQKIPANIDSRITLSKDNTGRWVFSSRTVSAIPALYDAIRELPPQYVPDENQFVVTLGPSITRTTISGWSWLLCAILAGVVLGKVASSILHKIAESLRSRGANVRAIAVDNTASPANLVLITIGLSVGLQFIYAEPALRGMTNATLMFLYIIALGWLSYNLVEVLDAVMRKLTEKTDNKLDDQIVPLIRKSLRIFLVILFSLVLAQNVFGLNITGWLAGLGIAGLAISLAAQDSIKNLFGSITVFFDRPFIVGDWVKIGTTEGEVEEVGFRSTRIRTMTDSQVTLPNANLISAEVDNLGSRRCRRWRTTLGVEYSTTPEQLIGFTTGIRELIRLHPYTRKANYEVWVNNFGASSIDIILVVVFEVLDISTEMRERERLMLDIMRLASALNVNFAFPTQTIHIAKDPEPQTQPQTQTDAEPQSQPEQIDPAQLEKQTREKAIAIARAVTHGQSWQTQKPDVKQIPELPPAPPASATPPVPGTTPIASTTPTASIAPIAPATMTPPAAKP